MSTERFFIFMKTHALLGVGVVGLGIITGIFITDQSRTIDRPFFNERILLTPPSSVYRAHDIRPVDHVWGSPQAPIVVVEYSDLECPFCKPHFYKMRDLVNEYQGRVSWVFRHHPLDHLHSKARKEAEAAECAADLGGPSYFWRYVDSVYQVTPSNNGLDLALLPKLAEDLGLSRGAFETCLSSGKFSERVSEDINDAQNAGITVTPSVVIFYGDGKRSLVVGSQSTETFRRVFNYLLTQ